MSRSAVARVWRTLGGRVRSVCWEMHVKWLRRRRTTAAHGLACVLQNTGCDASWDCKGPQGPETSDLKMSRRRWGARKEELLPGFNKRQLLCQKFHSLRRNFRFLLEDKEEPPGRRE